MYECEEILKEKFNIIKSFLEEKKINCEIDLIRNYMIQIKVNDNKFKLYYSPKKDTFKTEFINGFDSNIKEEIKLFIENGGMVKSKVNKEVVKNLLKEKDKRNLEEIYNIISKYKNCNIEYEPLVNQLFKICTDKEKKYIKENMYNFKKLEEITKKYI